MICCGGVYGRREYLVYHFKESRWSAGTGISFMPNTPVQNSAHVARDGLSGTLRLMCARPVMRSPIASMKCSGVSWDAKQ